MDIEKEMQQKMRPFLPIKRVFDNEFISLVTELIFLIRSYGIDKVGFSNIKKDYKLFISAVHDGWKKAQIKISHNVINKLSEIESLEIKKKNFIDKKTKMPNKSALTKSTL